MAEIQVPQHNDDDSDKLTFGQPFRFDVASAYGSEANTEGHQISTVHRPILAN